MTPTNPDPTDPDPTGDRPQVVVDTNIFVGAAFRPRSASGRVVEGVREGRLRMRWSRETRRETRAVLRRIPPIAWEPFEGLFREEDRVELEDLAGDPVAVDLEAVKLEAVDLDWIPDPADRKFAAVARAVGAALITNDDHFLAGRERADFPVLTPGEFVRLQDPNPPSDQGPTGPKSNL